MIKRPRNNRRPPVVASRANRPNRANLVNRAQVRQMIDSRVNRLAELKYVDATPLAASTLTTTMTTTMMSAISAGTSVNGRIGELVLNEKLEYRLSFTVGDATNIFRFMVLIDDQPNGAAFAQTDLFENAADPTSPLNWQYAKRFRVLKDRVFTLDTYNPTLTMNETIMINALCKYNGTSNAIANIATGPVYVVMLSDSGAVPQPTVSGNIRLWFRDG